MSEANPPPTTASYLNSKVIPRHWFPVGKEVNYDYVKAVCGVKVYEWTEKDVNSIVKKMKKDKKEVYSWARGQIETQITSNIRDMGVDVTSWESLKAMFKNDKSPEFAAKLWQACYGDFDETGWELELESKYMGMKGWSYEESSSPTKPRKGCLAREITRCKCELLKALNKVGARTHGGQIRVKRKSEEVDRTEKQKRRKKGTALGNFFSLLDESKPVTFFLKKQKKVKTNLVSPDGKGLKPGAVTKQKNGKEKDEAVDWKKKYFESKREMKKMQGVLSEEIVRNKQKEDGEKQKLNREKINKFKKSVKQKGVVTVAVEDDDLSDDDSEEDESTVDAAEVDDESTDEEDDDLMKKEIIMTPTDPEEKDDNEEDDEEPDPDDYQSILGHRKRSGEILLQVKFYNGKKAWVHIGFALADAPEMVEQYRLAKRLDDSLWNLGDKPGKRVLALLGHRGGGKHQEFQMLWDNGFMEWKHSRLVYPLAPKLVEDYDLSG